MCRWPIKCQYEHGPTSSRCVYLRRRVILYLTAQNLNGGEIYQKIVETFGENIITKQKVFHQMLPLFCDRFHYCLSFERLNKMTPRMTQLGTPTTGCSMFILTLHRLHSLYHNEIYIIVWSKYQLLKTSMIAHSGVTVGSLTRGD